MTPNETLLQKLANWRPTEGRQTLHVSYGDSGWSLFLTADRVDDLGCQAWEVLLKRATRPSDAGTLESWAKEVADRVTGLLEPLKVVEVDVVRDQALLRSEKPTQRGNHLHYYEVLLTGKHEALVKRFQTLPTEGRRWQVSFVLTHEALAKLVSDLAAD